jgi:hypothetical protein
MTEEQKKQYTDSFETAIGPTKTILFNEYQEGRLKDTEYAKVLAEILKTAISQAAQLMTTLTLLDKEEESKEVENAIKRYQLNTLLPDEHNKNLVQIRLSEKQIVAQDAEIAYTEARKDTVLKSRIDNLLLEVMKAQMDKIASLGTGGIVVGEADFKNELLLLKQAWRRTRGLEIEDVPFEEAASDQYTKK